MSNPEIMLITFDPDDDDYTAYVIKTNRLEEAHGTLEVYASPQDVGDQDKRIAELSAPWYSPASMRTLGEGTLKKAARGKHVIAVQKHVDGSTTRSTKPYEVP